MIAILFFVLAKIGYGQNSPILDRDIPLLMSIASANMLLMFHNLAPASPFDGGRLLQIVLGIRLSKTQAIQIPAWIGQVFAIVFGIITVVFNPALLMNAFGMFCGARQQAAIEQVIVLAEANTCPPKPPGDRRLTSSEPDAQSVLRTSDSEITSEEMWGAALPGDYRGGAKKRLKRLLYGGSDIAPFELPCRKNISSQIRWSAPFLLIR